MIRRLLAVLSLALLAVASCFAQLTGQAVLEKLRRVLAIRDDSVVAQGVDTGTGAFAMELPVMQVEGARQINFVLRYNSLLNFSNGEMSPGWGHPFEAFLSPPVPGPIFASQYRVNLDSERIISFTEAGSGFVNEDPEGRYERLESRPSNAGWRLIRRDGTELWFDAQGRLQEERNHVRQRLEFSYSGGRLSQVREPISNRSMRLHYNIPTGVLRSITDEADRISYFGYDNARRLVAVHPPARMSPVPNLSQINRTIPDNNQTGVTTNVPVNGRGPVGIVRIEPGSISHARPADLRVSVISPSGTSVELTFGNAQAPLVNLSGIAFDDFWGEDPNGSWRVVIRDVVAGTEGSVSPLYLRFTDLTTPTRFTYGGGGRLTGIFDADGNRMLSNVYDGFGRIVEQDDTNDTNLPAQFAYQESPSEVRTQYSDRLGNEWEYRHNAQHRLLQVADPLNRTTRFTYDANGNRISLVDALNRITRFQYDADGNLTQTTDPQNGIWQFSYTTPQRNLVSVRDPLGKTTGFAYDDNNNMRVVQDALGNRDTRSFNSNSQMTGNLMSDGGGINFTYQGGKPVGVSHAAPSGRHGTDSASAGYDVIGLPTTIADADGFETKYEYDDQGREIRKTNPLGNSEEFEYDIRGRVVRHTDFRGNATTYEYDGNDNLVRVTDALSRSITYRYDGEDRTIAIRAPDGSEGKMVYDAAGQLIEEIDALGNKRSYVYDAVGNLIEDYDGNGKLIERINYNALDLPILKTDADGNQVGIHYDAMGQPIRLVNPIGQELLTTFDDIGRPIQTADSTGRTFRQNYEQDDMVRRIIDANGVTQLTFSYDPANRIASAETRTGFHRWQYNNRDLVTRYTTPTGQQFNHEYDDAGQLTAIRPGGTGSAGARTLSYTYDKNGNPVFVTRESAGESATIVRHFDEIDRVSRYFDERGNMLRFTYDERGNVSSLRYPDSKQVFYTYDTANRLEEVRDWAGRRTRYHYDANSRITRIDFPNGTSRVMRYDTRGRVVQRQDRMANGLRILDYRFQYGPNGLLQAENAGHSDGVTLPSPASFEYNNQNQITRYLNQNVIHDQNGRMTRGPVGSGVQDLAYDFSGNLISAGDMTFTYDGEDRLVRMTNGSSTHDLVVNPVSDLSQVLMKTSSGGSSAGTTYYVWGIGLAYEVGPDDQIRVYHYDQRGSVVAFSDGSGQVSGRVSYGPYGEITGTSGNTDSLYLFQGLTGAIHAPNGLNMMGVRWYSSTAKRFLSEDPYFGTILRPRSVNRYTYAGSDPINFHDPSGKIFNLIGAAVGAVVGVVVQGVSDIIAGEFSGPEAYIGAAIGGFVGGLIVTSTGCIPCAGAGGAAVELLVTKGLRGEPINPVELLVVAAVGGVTAKVGDKAGKVIGAAGRRSSKALGKVLGKNAARPAAQQFNRRALKKALAREAQKQKWREIAGTIPEDFGTGLAEELVTRPSAVRAVTNPSSAAQATQRIPAVLAATAEGVSSLNRSRNAAYGEYIHWRYFQEMLQLSAVPALNNPNNALTGF